MNREKEEQAVERETLLRRTLTAAMRNR